MLRPLAENLWSLESDLRLPGGLWFPIRTTIIKLNGGDLVLHAPIAIDDATAEALRALGPVRHVVAPTRFHHLFVKPALERFAGARLLASPAVVKKRPDLPADVVLSSRLDGALEDDLEVIPIDGAPNAGEFVFVHRPTATLIVSDLVFHILQPRGWVTNLVLTVVGARGKMAQSRVWRHMTRDRAAAGRSVRRVLAHDLKRLVPAHGAVIEGDPRPALETTLKWMLEGAARIDAAGDRPSVSRA
jgi:hypothetical protein